MKRIVSAIAVLLVLGVFWLAFKPRPDVTVDAAMRSETIDRLVAQLNDHYVFPDKARQMQALLRERQQQGSYDGIGNGYRLVQQLTADLHGVARDKHLKLWFAPGLDPIGDTDRLAPVSQQEWKQRTNFVKRFTMRRSASREVKQVSRLGAELGYLKISGFPPAFLMTGTFGAAMDELADTEGLVVDLRHNGGGDPASVALLISYFVDQRTRLNDIWDRDTGTTTQQWTHDKLDGARYGGRKPVMILVGPRTASAGEDFAYTMQTMGRATVIGGPTWGGAHPARLYRIGENMYVQMPNQRAVNPITGTNWEGSGVMPDIAAPPDSALGVATRLLRGRLAGRSAQVAAAP